MDEIAADVVKVFNTYRVAIVLSGHEHLYMRYLDQGYKDAGYSSFLPLKSTYVTVANFGVPDDNSGTKLLGIGKTPPQNRQTRDAFQPPYSQQAAHHQRDLLREIIQKVVVYENALRIFYYSGPNDDVSLAATAEEIEQRLLGTPKMTEPPTAVTSASSAGIMRSGVRLSYKLVGETGQSSNCDCLMESDAGGVKHAH